MGLDSSQGCRALSGKCLSPQYGDGSGSDYSNPRIFCGYIYMYVTLLQTSALSDTIVFFQPVPDSLSLGKLEASIPAACLVACSVSCCPFKFEEGGCM